jgi:hypothetical protein
LYRRLAFGRHKALPGLVSGLTLHAAVRCGADDRPSLEPLCRCITRPALANEGVQTNAAGQVVLKLKTPWRDGTTHLVMSPLEFMQRLAALVPRPRLHLIRFHGVLAPNAKLRIIAAILEQPVIEKILTHLGLQVRAPPRAAARVQALQALQAA